MSFCFYSHRSHSIDTLYQTWHTITHITKTDKNVVKTQGIRYQASQSLIHAWAEDTFVKSFLQFWCPEAQSCHSMAKLKRVVGAGWCLLAGACGSVRVLGLHPSCNLNCEVHIFMKNHYYCCVFVYISVVTLNHTWCEKKCAMTNEKPLPTFFVYVLKGILFSTCGSIWSFSWWTLINSLKAG